MLINDKTKTKNQQTHKPLTKWTASGSSLHFAMQEDITSPV